MLSVQFVKKLPVKLNSRIYATKPDIENQTECFRRRSILVTTVTSAGAALVKTSSGSDYRLDSLKDADTEKLQITNKVVLELGTCSDKSRLTRTLGQTSFCDEVIPLGTITIGVYGDRLPITVSNFLMTVSSGAYNGSILNKVRTGEYFSFGKQGSRRNGEVEPPSNLQSNSELVSPKAFSLTHSRPGTVSLAIEENEDLPDRTLSANYHPTQILITTGPGPAPQLDKGNVVIGRVIDGFNTLARIAEVRTYKPSSRVQAFNELATAIGDERAREAKKQWGKPIRPLVISSASIADF